MKIINNNLKEAILKFLIDNEGEKFTNKAIATLLDIDEEYTNLAGNIGTNLVAMFKHNPYGEYIIQKEEEAGGRGGVKYIWGINKIPLT